MTGEPDRILLILPTWVGDVVMATPFIRSLFDRFPQAEITLLMNRHLYSVLEGSPWAASCVFWPPRKKSPEAKQQHKALLAALRAQKFDLAVMLPNSLRSAWLSFRSGARRRVGFNRDGRGLLLTDRVPVPNRANGSYEPMPLCDYYAVLAEALGMGHPGDGLQLFLTEADDRAVEQRLRAEGLPVPPLLAQADGRSFYRVEAGRRQYLAVDGVYKDLVRPKGVTTDRDGNVYVIESYYDHLLIYNQDGELLLPIGGTGNDIGRFFLPAGAWSDDRDRIFVADMFNARVVIFRYVSAGA